MSGYSKVAKHMTENSELAIFRRFRKLSIRNLLYFQAKLIHLESEFEQIHQEDQHCPSKRYHSSDWYYLSKEGDNAEQWQKALEIHETLKIYNKCLRLQASPDQLKSPSRYDLEVMRDWLKTNRPLKGFDRHWINEDFEQDLVAVCPNRANDKFSRAVRENAVPWLHRWVTDHFTVQLPAHSPSILQSTNSMASPEIARYSDDKLLAAVELFSISFLSLLVILSVLMLYLVSSMVARITLLAGLTMLFSLCLKYMTGARPIDICAATATFAAVQVVFIGNNTYSA